MTVPVPHLELKELNVLMADSQSYSLQTLEQKPKAFMWSGYHKKYICTELVLPIKHCGCKALYY